MPTSRHEDTGTRSTQAIQSRSKGDYETLGDGVDSNVIKDPKILQHIPKLKKEDALKNLSDLLEYQKELELATWVNEQFREMKSAREPFEQQWYINLAMYNGQHYVSPVNVTGQGFRLRATNAPAHRVRLVVNKIRTAAITEHSKLCQNKPIPVVVPSTGEKEDFVASNVAELILKNEFATKSFDETYRTWIWWGVITGTSYMKSYWDKSATDADRSPKGKGEVKGKIRTEAIAPFFIYVPDIMIDDIDRQPYVLHAMTRSPEYIKRVFGVEATCDSSSVDSILESRFLAKGTQNRILDSVLVKEMWIKPNGHKDFPLGGMITVINDRVQQYIPEWPWPFKEYPFYKYSGIRTGAYYGDSIIVDLISLNKEYNRTKSQSLEIKNAMGKPKLLYQEGSLNPRKITSETGQSIGYRPGFDKPGIFPGVEVPVSMGVELDRLSNEFDDISGQHEITRGNTPSQVTSGTAIAYLQEQDDVKLSDRIGNIEYNIEKLGKHYLKYVSEFWKTERLVKAVGRDQAFEANLWKNSDLRGNTDVQVQSGSALPFSKAAKTAQVVEFMQNGFLDPTTGLELLQLGGMDKVLNEALIDKRQAERENLKFLVMDEGDLEIFLTPPANLEQRIDQNNQEIAVDADTQEPYAPQSPIPVNTWDNHEAHIQFHNMFRKTQEFELLSDLHKQAVELHVQAHQMAMMATLQGQMGNLNMGPMPMEQPPSEEEQQQQEPPTEEELMQQEQENSKSPTQKKVDKNMQDVTEKHF